MWADLWPFVPLPVIVQVQKEFSDRTDVYLNFLSIMRDFKAGK